MKKIKDWLFGHDYYVRGFNGCLCTIRHKKGVLEKLFNIKIERTKL